MWIYLQYLIVQGLFVGNPLVNLFFKFPSESGILGNGVEQEGEKVAGCVDSCEVETDELLDDFFLGDQRGVVYLTVLLGLLFKLLSLFHFACVELKEVKVFSWVFQSVFH